MMTWWKQVVKTIGNGDLTFQGVYFFLCLGFGKLKFLKQRKEHLFNIVTDGEQTQVQGLQAREQGDDCLVPVFPSQNFSSVRRLIALQSSKQSLSKPQFLYLLFALDMHMQSRYRICTHISYLQEATYKVLSQMLKCFINLKKTL